MPVACRIYPDLRLIVITSTGKLTLTDIIKGRDEMLAHPDFAPTFDRLYDYQGVEEVVPIQDRSTVIDLAERARTGSDLGGSGKTAVVASTDAIFGMARRFEAYAAGSSARQWRAFRSIEDAQAWLGVPLEQMVGALTNPAQPHNP